MSLVCGSRSEQLHLIPEANALSRHLQCTGSGQRHQAPLRGVQGRILEGFKAGQSLLGSARGCQCPCLHDLDGGWWRRVGHEGDDFDRGSPCTGAESLAGRRTQDPHRIGGLAGQRVVLRGRQPRRLLGCTGDGTVHGSDPRLRRVVIQLVLQELPEQRMDACPGRRFVRLAQEAQRASILEVRTDLRRCNGSAVTERAAATRAGVTWSMSEAWSRTRCVRGAMRVSTSSARKS